MTDHTRPPHTSSGQPADVPSGKIPSIGEGSQADVAPVATWRRLAAIGVSHLMGIGAWMVLSPVIVGYTFLTLAALGFALLGAGVAENGSLVQDAVFAALAIGDGAWVEWVWRRDLSFEENALRLFGGVGLLLWLGELLLSLVRRRRGTPPPDLWHRLKRFAFGLAGFTALLSTVLLVGVLMTQSRDVGLDTMFVLRGIFTAYAMGGVLLLFCGPSLAFWFFIDAARGPVADVVAGSSRAGGPAVDGL
jgi:hypothetical protein